MTHALLLGFLCDHVARNKGSTKSIRGLLSQLRVYSRGLGQAWLTEADAYRLKRTVAALEYEDSTPSQAKEPATLNVLLTVCRHLDHQREDHRAFEVSLFLGHNGLLRAAELHSGLKVRDLRWDWRRREVSFPLHRTKTHRRGPPVEVTLREYNGPCAFVLLQNWFDRHSLWHQPNAHVLPEIRQSRGVTLLNFERALSRRQWALALKAHFRRAGYDDTRYSGHSLRAGGATDLFTLGTPYPIIKKAGRWASDAALQYFRERDHVAQEVALSFGRQVQCVMQRLKCGTGEGRTDAERRSRRDTQPIRVRPVVAPRTGHGSRHGLRPSPRSAPRRTYMHARTHHRTLAINPHN